MLFISENINGKISPLRSCLAPVEMTRYFVSDLLPIVAFKSQEDDNALFAVIAKEPQATAANLTTQQIAAVAKAPSQ